MACDRCHPNQPGSKRDVLPNDWYNCIIINNYEAKPDVLRIGNGKNHQRDNPDDSRGRNSHYTFDLEMILV